MRGQYTEVPGFLDKSVRPTAGLTKNATLHFSLA